jgi:hypothetical protein
MIFAPSCGAQQRPQGAASAPTPSWENIVTSDDRKRLREWRTAFTKGLAKAQASGHGDAIAREDGLLDPDAALSWRAPAPGIYRCRTIKIGSQAEGMLDYIAYPPFDCRIGNEDGIVSFVKLSGSQRPVGRILPYADKRMVFLGTLQLGDETRALDYGRDRERDLAAVVERLGERKWRLVFPYPHFESTIDVMELVPKPAS